VNWLIPPAGKQYRKKQDAHLQDIEKKQFISLTHEKSQ
jgi:hypothetical protein